MDQIEKKLRSDTQKSLLSFIQYFVPTQERVFGLDLPSDATNAGRALCEGKPKDVAWRRDRSWVLAEDVAWDVGESASLMHPGSVMNLIPISIDSGERHSPSNRCHSRRTAVCRPPHPHPQPRRLPSGEDHLRCSYNNRDFNGRSG